MAERTVKAVYVTYREKVEDAAGVKRVVSRTASRGTKVNLSSDEEKRLDALGGLVTDGDESTEAILARALNPTDVSQPTPGEPVTVSPPALGGEPAGDQTKGDTGADDVQPEPGASPEGGGAAAPAGAEYDAREKSLDEVTAWLRDAKPSGPKTVAAAHGDAAAAETLIEAEKLVSGDDPRKTVVEPLEKVIASADSGDGDGSGSGDGS